MNTVCFMLVYFYKFVQRSFISGIMYKNNDTEIAEQLLP